VAAGYVRQQQRVALASHDISLNQRLHGLLAETSLVLAEERLTAPERLTMEFNLAAQELRAIQQEAKKIQMAAARSAASAAKAEESAATASRDLTDAVARLDASVLDVARGVQDTREATSTQVAEAGRSAQLSAAALSAAVSGAVAETTSASRSVALVHEELKQLIRSMDQQVARAVADGVASGVAPIATATAELSQHAAALSAATTQSLSEAQRVVLDQRSSLGEANSRLEEVVRQVDTNFAATVQSLSASMQGQAYGYEAAVDAAGKITGSVHELHRALDVLAAEVRALRDRIDDPRGAAGRPTIGLGGGTAGP
jgi:hypothetical protein